MMKEYSTTKVQELYLSEALYQLKELSNIGYRGGKEAISEQEEAFRRLRDEKLISETEYKKLTEITKAIKEAPKHELPYEMRSNVLSLSSIIEERLDKHFVQSAEVLLNKQESLAPILSRDYLRKDTERAANILGYETPEEWERGIKSKSRNLRKSQMQVVKDTLLKKRAILAQMYSEQQKVREIDNNIKTESLILKEQNSTAKNIEKQLEGLTETIDKKVASILKPNINIHEVTIFNKPKSVAEIISENLKKDKSFLGIKYRSEQIKLQGRSLENLVNKYNAIEKETFHVESQTYVTENKIASLRSAKEVINKELTTTMRTHKIEALKQELGLVKAPTISAKKGIEIKVA
jgi:hypothetical protein